MFATPLSKTLYYLTLSACASQPISTIMATKFKMLTVNDVIPAKFKDRERKIKDLRSYAEENGLENHEILDLLNLIVSNKYGSLLSSLIIKALIPNTKLLTELLITALCYIGMDLPLMLKTGLFKWIAAVYNLLEDDSELHCLYDAIFYHVENETLSSHACNLLCKLSKDTNVRRFHVEKLLKLHEKQGSRYHTFNLLQKYGQFYPGLVNVKLKTKGSFDDGEYLYQWIRKINPTLLSNGTMNEQLSENVHTCSEPSVSGTEIQEIEYQMKDTLADQSHLVALDLTQPVARIKSMLDDPRLLVTSVMYPEYEMHQRLNARLKHILTEEYISCSKTKLIEDRNIFWEKIINYLENAQRGLPTIDSFVAKLFHSGNQNYEFVDVWKLVPWCLNWSAEDINFILKSIKVVFSRSDDVTMIKILNAMTRLLQNLALQAYSCNVSPVESSASRFNESLDYSPILEIINTVISLVNDLMLQLFEAGKTSSTVMHFALYFYEKIPHLQLNYSVPIIVLPPGVVIYYCLFSSNALDVSRITMLFCRYKEAFQSLKHCKVADNCNYRNISLEHINSFNHYLVDFCNSLWNETLFTNPSPHGPFHEFPQYVIGNIPHVEKTFSIWHHWAFIGLFEKFLKSKHRGSSTLVDQNDVDAKKEYLEYLADQGYPGIQEFVQQFVDLSVNVALTE